MSQAGLAAVDPTGRDPRHDGQLADPDGVEQAGQQEIGRWVLATFSHNGRGVMLLAERIDLDTPSRTG